MLHDRKAPRNRSCLPMPHSFSLCEHALPMFPCAIARRPALPASLTHAALVCDGTDLLCRTSASLQQKQKKSLARVGPLSAAAFPSRTSAAPINASSPVHTIADRTTPCTLPVPRSCLAGRSMQPRASTRDSAATQGARRVSGVCGAARTTLLSGHMQLPRPSGPARERYVCASAWVRPPVPGSCLGTPRARVPGVGARRGRPLGCERGQTAYRTGCAWCSALTRRS